MLIEERKLRKLKRDPYLFFADMFAKKKRQFVSFLPKRKVKKGFSSYTVVSACYNVEAYLDRFFTALIQQRLSFRRNIHCVMVDDGSTDQTAAIILKWQKKYPGNITYLHQENAGQGAARNLGLRHVQTPWVTFTDPDDFLGPEYFLTIDDFLKRQKKPVAMIGTRVVFFHEDKNLVKENHPLDFKFRQPELVIPLEKLDREVQLHVASAFFPTSIVLANQIRFDARVKPDFEDAHFIAHYLDKASQGSVAYLREALYFYRKRSNHTSTLDKAWTDKRKFYDVLVFGKLDILKAFGERKYIQNTVLYDLIWYIKYLVNNPERAAFLNDEEKARFLELLDECFRHIAPETIHRFNLAGCWFFHKVGILHCFRHEEVESQITYLEAYDPCKKEVKLRYFCGEEALEECFAGKEELIPTHAKTVRHDFLGRTFCLERILWLPLEGASGKLRCCINGREARITFRREQLKEVDPAAIPQAFASTAKVFAPDAPWLIFDRDTQADDNAEHLYRWIRANHPEKNTWFVLRKTAKDWARLEKEGFRLLAYGTPEHEALLRGCAKIISSHIDGFVVNYFQDSSTDDKQICFLQHGVIKDDLSRWLNSKKRIDLFVTETPDEYRSIAGDGSRYRYTDKEVKLLGLPRHDALLTKPGEEKRRLLIQPTWRNNLMGHQIEGNLREKNPDFMASDYARAWSGVLHSEALRTLCARYGFDVVFFPHANIEPYLDEFRVPDYIRVMHAYEGSIQEVFRSSSVMLTDYSSVAFEMALLQKAVLYYQFDEESFFGGQHTYQKGYFDYRRHGFGPVATDPEALMAELEAVLARGGRPTETYLERMRKTFLFRDGKNCERVYNAICALDDPNPEGWVNTEVLSAGIRTAIRKEAWDAAARRAEKLAALRQDEESRVLKKLCDFRAAISQGRLLRASELQSELEPLADPVFLKGKILLAVFQERWTDALDLLKERKDDESVLLRALSLEKLGRNLDGAEGGGVALDYTRRDWARVLECAADSDASAPVTLSILACRAARELSAWEKEGHFRSLISARFGRNFVWRLLAALRSSVDGRKNAMKDVFENLRLAFPEGCAAMPETWLHLYARAALAENRLEEVQKALEASPSDPVMLTVRWDFFSRTGRWQEAAEAAQRLLESGDYDDWLGLATCLTKAARYDEAYALLKRREASETEALPYWRLRARLAEYFLDPADMKTCWHNVARLDAGSFEEAADRLSRAEILSRERPQG